MTQATARDFVTILLAPWWMNERAQTREEVQFVEMAIAIVERMVSCSMLNTT